MSSYRQSQLILGYSSVFKAQTAIGTPLALVDIDKALNVVTRQHIQPETKLEDVFSCNGKWLIDSIVVSRLGRLQIEMDADADVLPGFIAMALGVSGAPGSIVAGNEVQTLSTSGTPTGGGFKLKFDGETTTAFTFDESAADAQSALEALVGVGAGDLVCAGGPLPTPITITGGAALANTDIPLIEVVEKALTGGTSPNANVVLTTQGGPARKSHLITQDPTGFQRPATTFVVGFEGETPILFSDAVLNQITITARVGARTRVTVDFVGNGALNPATGYVYPPDCQNIAPILFTDGSHIIDAVEYQSRSRGWTLTINNNLLVDTDPFTGASVDPFRIETADKVDISFAHLIEGTLNDALYAKAKLNKGKGKLCAQSVRVGGPTHGVTFSMPAAFIRPDATPQGFDGEANRAILNLLGLPTKADTDANKPINATAINQTATQYILT